MAGTLRSLLRRPRRGLPVVLAAGALGACGGGETTDVPVPAATPASEPPPVETAPAERPSAAGAGDPAGLVERWYALADPSVCDAMTEEMIEYGWGAPGAAGREACRASLAAAEPAEDVVVGEAEVEGDTATVSVEFVLEGERVTDVVQLVRVGGDWLIDNVAPA